MWQSYQTSYAYDELRSTAVQSCAPSRRLSQHLENLGSAALAHRKTAAELAIVEEMGMSTVKRAISTELGLSILFPA